MSDPGPPGTSSFQQNRCSSARLTVSSLSRSLARRKWPLFLLSMFVFFSMGHLAGGFQKEQDILKAKAIVAEGYELRGPDGKPAALLHLTPQGQGELSFLDDTGRPRIEVGFDGLGSPGVRLLGPDRHLRASLAVDRQTGALRN